MTNNTNSNTKVSFPPQMQSAYFACDEFKLFKPITMFCTFVVQIASLGTQFGAK